MCKNLRAQRNDPSDPGVRIPKYVDRLVPAIPLRLTLVATHQTAAPINALASRALGTFYSVEGVVDFTPAAGGHYVINGELKENGSAVWIEDAATRQAVTPRIRSRP